MTHQDPSATLPVENALRIPLDKVLKYASGLVMATVAFCHFFFQQIHETKLQVVESRATTDRQNAERAQKETAQAKAESLKIREEKEALDRQFRLRTPTEPNSSIELVTTKAYLIAAQEAARTKGESLITCQKQIETFNLLTNQFIAKIREQEQAIAFEKRLTLEATRRTSRAESELTLQRVEHSSQILAYQSEIALTKASNGVLTVENQQMKQQRIAAQEQAKNARVKAAAIEKVFDLQKQKVQEQEATIIRQLFKIDQAARFSRLGFEQQNQRRGGVIGINGLIEVSPAGWLDRSKTVEPPSYYLSIFDILTSPLPETKPTTSLILPREFP